MRPVSRQDRFRRSVALVVLLVAGLASLATSSVYRPPTVEAEASGGWWVADGTPVSVPLVVRLWAVERNPVTVLAWLTESERVSASFSTFEAVVANPSDIYGENPQTEMAFPPCAEAPCEWDLLLDIGRAQLPVTETRVHWTVRAELEYDGTIAPTLTVEAGSQGPSPTVDSVTSAAMGLVVLVVLIAGVIALTAAAVMLPRRRRRSTRSVRPVRSSNRPSSPGGRGRYPGPH